MLSTSSSPHNTLARQRLVVSKRFGRAAKSYDAEASIQTEICRRLLSYSGEISGRVLDVGCGTGELSAQLLLQAPKLDLTAIDLSTEMVETARTRPSLREVHFAAVDLVDYQSSHRFDNVLSASAFQWIRPLAQGFQRVSDLMVDGGRFNCALMLSGTLSELRLIRNETAPTKPNRTILPTQEEIFTALQKCGLTLESARKEALIYLADDAPALLKTLHRLGAASAGSAILNRGELRRLCAEYERRFSEPSGQVRATYDVLFFSALRT